MKILVFGSDGFIGHELINALEENHEVYGSARNGGDYRADLGNKASVAALLARVSPEVIVSCAGIVANDERARLNPIFSRNILEAAAESGQSFKRIIIMGSAAEYGMVERSDSPVGEDAAIKPVSDYGRSKAEEVSQALALAHKHHLPLVVVRPFNPFGAGMNPRQLIPALINQLEAIKDGQMASIEINRLDTERDYVDVRDVAGAIKAVIEGEPLSEIYNVGSGHATTNAQLLDKLVAASALDANPHVSERLSEPEPPAAAQADISRLASELGWKPRYTITQTIEGIINAKNAQ